MTTNKKTTNKKDVAEIVTERFIQALEAGTVPWIKPWEHWLSWSRATGNDYQGANLLTLSGGEYVTFKQAKEQGIKINKGAKSEIIVKYTEYKKTINKEDLNKAENLFRYRPDQIEDLGNGKVKVPAKSVKYFNVFNVESCTDAEPKHTKSAGRAHTWDAIEEAEKITAAYTKAYKIEVDHIGNEAYNRDNPFSEGGKIQLPRKEQFICSEAYYSAFFHELIHSTAKAVNRDKSAYSHSKKARAREELVAEIGAAYIMSYLGIESGYSIENSKAYVADWATFLKSDPNAILYAAPKAIEAAELIIRAAN